MRPHGCDGVAAAEDHHHGSTDSRVCLAGGFGVRGLDCALGLGDMSPSRKAATCRRTPKKRAALASGS